MFIDPLYFVFALPAFLLALYAQFRVQAAYGKYSRQPNMRGVSGVEAAHILLQQAGLRGVTIEGTPGQLTDHYDPRGKVLRLSLGVGNGRSVAALGIVAHEVGHAQQDFQGYAPLRFRSMLVPVTNFGTWMGPILFFLGLMLNSVRMAEIGLIAFSVAVVFTAVTLPVELNADGTLSAPSAPGLGVNVVESRLRALTVQHAVMSASAH